MNGIFQNARVLKKTVIRGVVPGEMMEINQLRKRVGEIDWFHTIDLGNGIVTPGVGDTPSKLAHIRMPEDLSGQPWSR